MMSSTEAFSGRFTVFEMAPEMNGCVAAIILQVAHVVDRARALGRLEGAIEHRQMLVLNVRRAFDGAGGVDVADDRVRLRRACSPA